MESILKMNSRSQKSANLKNKESAQDQYEKEQ